ncbi:hypothetical protein [Limnochorda pilosa]|nr:hypothetical protein [Limnochorda pilosa]
MLRALDKPTNPIDRHFLLLKIVEATYKERQNPPMRDLCKRVAQMHVDEFPRIAAPLKKDLGTMPRVPTFVWLASLLAEDGEYDAAIKVCQLAQRYGLRDGTKGSFEARIGGIRKAKQRAQQER